MSASEFLRNVTAEEIKKASDDSDKAEDAANGRMLSPAEFIERMGSRLASDYPGLHKRIEQLIEGQASVSSDEAFLIGIMAGALMVAHDITIAAEVHDANGMLGDPSSS